METKNLVWPQKVDKYATSRGGLVWPEYGDRFCTEREYSHAMSDEPIHEREGNVLSISGFGIKVEQRRNMTKLKLGPEFKIKENENPDDHFIRMNKLLEESLKKGHDKDMEILEREFKEALRKQVEKINKYLKE